jgi:nucleotide-binding universal stress UspA family protein
MLFQKILFPVDFSEPCQRLVPCVKAMQAATCAHLVLLHSIDLPRDWPTPGPVNEWMNYDSLRACDYERLRRFEADHFADRHPDLIQESGEPAAVISRYVEGQGVDLVMMPTQGYGFFRRALLGSVTTKVLHDLRCAVWTASHSNSAPSPDCKHVLCAIEEPRQGTELLRSAATLADTFGASLTIVNVYPDFAGTLIECYERRIPRRAEVSLRRRFDSLQKAAGTTAPVVIAGGEVNEVIAETARRWQADLVVTGRGTYGGFLLSLRSHLYDIVRSSPCPVLVLPEPAPEETLHDGELTSNNR